MKSYMLLLDKINSRLKKLPVTDKNLRFIHIEKYTLKRKFKNRS